MVQNREASINKLFISLKNLVARGENIFLIILVLTTLAAAGFAGAAAVGKTGQSTFKLIVTLITITGITTTSSLIFFNFISKLKNKQTLHFFFIPIPDNLKDLFIDSLKAFESYSKLSGYEVKFSFDNSKKDRLGFKFTVTENPNNIPNDEIRADIQDFLNKIQRGEKFDDLPVVINPFEHQIILSSLKARLSLIEHNFTLEKDLRTLYQSKLKGLLEIKNLFNFNPMTVNNNYLQSGGKNNSRKIEADNSNVNMGDGNFIEDNSIKIEHSFNEKKTIVEKIEYSIQQIDKEDALNPHQKQDLKRHLENIKEEITEEAKPDASKLKKSWEKIKKVAENFVLSKELTDALEWIGGMFNF